MSKDNVVEGNFKPIEKWGIEDIIHQVGKFKPKDLSQLVVIYELKDGGVVGLLGSEADIPQRVGTLEIAKLMTLSLTPEDIDDVD